MSDEKQRLQRIGAGIHQTSDRPQSRNQLYGPIVVSSKRVTRAVGSVVQGWSASRLYGCVHFLSRTANLSNFHSNGFMFQ